MYVYLIDWHVVGLLPQSGMVGETWEDKKVNRWCLHELDPISVIVSEIVEKSDRIQFQLSQCHE